MIKMRTLFLFSMRFQTNDNYTLTSLSGILSRLDCWVIVAAAS